jgi:hypothetical protein
VDEAGAGGDKLLEVYIRFDIGHSLVRVRWRWPFLCRVDCDYSVSLIRKCTVGFCGEIRPGFCCRVPAIEPDCSMWRWSVAG